MREAKILAIVLGIALLMLFVREGSNDISPLDILPFFGDRPVDVFDFGGLVLVAIALLTLIRGERR